MDVGEHVQDIQIWLAELGLAKYTPAFEEAEIEFADLAYLSEDDLKEMGLPIGPRRRITEAIRILTGKVDTETAAPHEQAVTQPGSDSASKTTAVPGTDAERRHLTVMFVDLVSSTEMASRLDAEDMRNVIIGYQNTVAGVVGRYDGLVAKFMGDGVMCYFGWPRAGEDDAERAVRAGLAIIESVRSIKAPDGIALATRIGVATGVVIVGDLIGSGPAQEAAVVGETPNLAARLQGIAQPNQIVLPSETQRLLGNTYQLTSIGAQELKGVGAPVEAFVVEGETSVESRFAARQSGTLSPIVGRDREIELMLERWTQARSGQGQMVVVNGEAGIGKSRITKAVIDAVAKDYHTRITYQCSPYHTDSAFYPVIQHLAFAAGFAPADGPDTRLDKLEALLGQDNDTLKLVAAMMGLNESARLGALEVSPAQQRAHTMKALAKLLVAQSRDRPVLLVYEDLHWIDPTSLELLDLLLDAITDQKIMILATARPSFEHIFGGHPIVTRFSLNRLGKGQIAAIVAKLTDNKPIPDEIMEVITNRTDGVPLFVEELTKTILESGALQDTGDRLVLDGPLSTIAIPTTLHDSLMARLDRLQPIKEVAQTAACIGREFGHGLLVQISSMSETALDTALQGLIEAELIYRRGLPPEASYLFKHALVRDAAYESLLKPRRQGIHERIFRVFEADDEVAPEIVAHHASLALLPEKAVLCWKRAGTIAQARPAYDEAANHIKAAISLVETLLDKPEWAEMHLRLLVQLAQIYISKEGYASNRASEAFAHALEKINSTENSELRVAIYYGTWIGPYIGGRLTESWQLANQLVEEMESDAEPISRLISLRMRAANLIAMGRSPEALKDLEISYSLYQSVDLTQFSSRFAQDPGVQIQCYQLLALWMCGAPERAVALGQATIERAQSLNHANTFCYAGLHDVTLSIWVGDSTRAREINDRMRLFAFDYDMDLWKVFCELHDHVIGCMDDDPRAIADLPKAIDTYLAIGCGLWKSLYRAEYAKALFRRGDLDGALAEIDLALCEIADSGEHWADAELLRIRGEIFFEMGKSPDAENSFKAAITIASTQKAKMLELRAALSLARTVQAGRSSEELSNALSHFGPEETAPDIHSGRQLMAGQTATD